MTKLRHFSQDAPGASFVEELPRLRGARFDRGMWKALHIWGKHEWTVWIQLPSDNQTR